MTSDEKQIIAEAIVDIHKKQLDINEWVAKIINHMEHISVRYTTILTVVKKDLT